MHSICLFLYKYRHEARDVIMSTSKTDHILRTFKRPQGAMGDIIAHHMDAEYAELNQWAIRNLNIQNEDNILEIGFGTGIAIQEISKLAHDGYTLGIDFSELMLTYAKQRNAAAIANGRVHLQYGCV